MTQPVNYDELFAMGLAEVLARKRADNGGQPSEDEQAIIQRYTRDFGIWRNMQMERRLCTKDTPMAMADRDKYSWGHPDAVEVSPPMRFGNAWVYNCPHCQLTFHAAPRES